MTIATSTPPLRDAFEQLRELSDPRGIVSLFVDTGAEHGGSGGELALRNAISDLRREVSEEGPPDRSRVLERRLKELSVAIGELLNSAQPGRGRALFAGLSGGAPRSLWSRHHLGTAAVLAPGAHLTPLLPAIEAEQPFGVISVSGDGVRALGLSDGNADEAAWLTFTIDAGEWRRMVGPASANPARRSTTASQRDLYRRRLEEHRERAASETVAPLVALAESRGWTRVLVSGSPALTEPLRRDWPRDAPPLLGADRRLVHTLSPEEVRRQAEPRLAEARRACQSELVKRAIDGALSSRGAAAVGLDDVLFTLREGQVHHLLLDPTFLHAGARAPDGRLVREGELPAGVRREELTPEPRLLDRMIERALATGAAVTSVEDPARSMLAERDGVAALLRWSR